MPIFNISIEFKLCQYCITGLMYHDMAIYRYIITSLVCIHTCHAYIIIYTYNSCDIPSSTHIGSLPLHNPLPVQYLTMSPSLRLYPALHEYSAVTSVSLILYAMLPLSGGYNSEQFPTAVNNTSCTIKSATLINPEYRKQGKFAVGKTW